MGQLQSYLKLCSYKYFLVIHRLMAGPLTNFFIEDIFLRDLYTQKIYKGFIYPRGNINIREEISKIKPPAIYVVNTDYKKRGGLHWILLVYLENKTLFLDPFGFSNLTYNYPFLVERGIAPVTRNIFKVQNWHTRSISCGHFIIIYGLMIARNFSLYEINNYFHPVDTEFNDILAIDFVIWLKEYMDQ